MQYSHTRSFDIRDELNSEECLLGGLELGSGTLHTSHDRPSQFDQGGHPAPGLVQLGSLKSIKWGTLVGEGQEKRVKV